MLLARQRVEDYSHLTNENKFLPLLEGEISQTSHLNLKSANTIVQDEDGNRVNNNKVLEKYFIVSPKNPRYDTVRKCITHDLPEFGFKPGLKERPKYPNFTAQPKINEELYLVKDPNHPIYRPHNDLFPTARAEYKREALLHEYRLTTPITKNTEEGCKELVKERYGKTSYLIDFSKGKIANTIKSNKAQPEILLYNTYEERDKKMTNVCLEADDLKKINKDVQGIHPCYTGLSYKSNSNHRMLAEDEKEEKSYAKIKTPYSHENYHFINHPMAESSNYSAKKILDKNLIVAYNKMNNAKHDIEEVPRSVGETELMRRIRRKKSYSPSYQQPKLTKKAFNPQLTSKVEHVEWDGEIPKYTSVPTTQQYLNKLSYNRPMRKGSSFELNMVRRRTLANEYIKSDLQSIQENHLKKNYRDNFVQNFEKLRVQPMTEKQKQQLKLDQKQRRKTMRERKREQPRSVSFGMDL